MARCLPIIMGVIELQEWNPIPTTSNGTKKQRKSCQTLTHQLLKRLMISPQINQIFDIWFGFLMSVHFQSSKHVTKYPS
jgi:hypothetical protein